MLSLLLAALPAPQTPAAPPAPQDERAWRRLDRVELVVNDALITRLELERTMQSYLEQEPISNQDQLQMLSNRILQDAVQELLLRQAGEDLGRDEKVVENVLENWWRSEIERSGGVREFSEKLESESTTSLRRKEQLASDIYRLSYVRVVTGRDPAPSGRVIADRYVRPGQRWRLFRAMERSQVGLPQIGGRSPTFVLLELLLPANSEEDLWGRKKELAEELYRRATEGEDFNALVNAYGALTGSAALSVGIPLDRLAQMAPELAEFCLDAEEGDITPIMPLRHPQTFALVGWRITRVLGVEEADIPKFESLETQLALESLVERDAENRRILGAVQRLYESAYVWPDIQEEARKQAEAQRAAAESGGSLPSGGAQEPQPPRP